MSNAYRKPAGAPAGTGGEYDFKPAASAYEYRRAQDSRLDKWSNTRNSASREDLERLEADLAASIEAANASDSREAGLVRIHVDASADGTDQWWAGAHATSPFSDGEDVLKFPENYRPNGEFYASVDDEGNISRLGGRAPDGNHRAQRQRVKVGGGRYVVDDNGNVHFSGGRVMTIPQRTHVEQLMDEMDTDSIDVPFSIEGATADGSITWARMTRTGRGPGALWHAEVPAMEDQPQHKKFAEEAVMAYMDRRDISQLSFAQVMSQTDEIDTTGTGTDMTRVDSSWMGAYGYDDKAGILYTTAKNTGKTYAHKVPRETYEMLHADKDKSFSSMWSRHQHSMESAGKAVKCSRCGQMRLAASAHRCKRAQTGFYQSNEMAINVARTGQYVMEPGRSSAENLEIKKSNRGKKAREKRAVEQNLLNRIRKAINRS